MKTKLMKKLTALVIIVAICISVIACNVPLPHPDLSTGSSESETDYSSGSDSSGPESTYSTSSSDSTSDSSSIIESNSSTTSSGSSSSASESGSDSGNGTDPKPDDPIVVPGKVNVKSVGGDFETLYVTWEENSAFSWYNVYVKESAKESYGAKIDTPLVRRYNGYFRADAVGLKAGIYDLKIVPLNSEGNESSENASEVKNISVLAHDRSGFAFVNGTSSGAYNENGTLKAGAVVLYITEQTKNSVTMNVTGANTNPCVGLQTILDGYKKGKETRPLNVRMIGNITDFDYMLNGDIVIENKNNSVAGITFEGIGDDATANGWGIRVKNASNVEIRNIGFMNTHSDEGDDIGLQQDNDHIWVHNCDLFYGMPGGASDQIKGDGALDTKDSTYVTHSYNHFWDCGKCNLQGMKSETVDNFITYHHNWYDHSDSRHPRIRTCTVHVYNNYFDGIAKYGVGATMGSSVFVENNYFRSEAMQRPMLISKQGTDISADPDGKGTFSGENGGIIKAYGNQFAGSGKVMYVPYSRNSIEFDAYDAKTRDEKVPSNVTTKYGGTSYNNFDTASTMYSYSVDTPEEAVAKTKKYAGRVGGGDFTFTFDDATEDANYNVITELKQKLLNYKTSLVEVGKIPAQGESGGNGESGGITIPQVEGMITSKFLGGAPENSALVASNNSAKNANFTVNALGETLSSGMKMESKTSLEFTITEEMVLVMYLDGGTGKNIKINGTNYTTVQTSDGDYVVVVTLSAGTYTITKGDPINLWYLTLTPTSAL